MTQNHVREILTLLTAVIGQTKDINNLGEVTLNLFKVNAICIEFVDRQTEVMSNATKSELEEIMDLILIGMASEIRDFYYTRDFPYNETTHKLMLFTAEINIREGLI